MAELTEELAAGFGMGQPWVRAPGEWQAEAPVLTLNSTLAATALGWQPRLQRRQAIEWTAAWYQAHRAGADMREFSLRQIAAYEEAGA